VALRRAAGIDVETGIVAVARSSRGGVSVEVAARSPGSDEEGLIRAARVPERAAVTALGGPQVFLRTMRLPGDLDSRAIADTVRWQLADVAPDRVIRHSVTGKVNDHWCVVVGGVPKEAARGIKAGALDLRVAALWRGAVHFLGEAGAGPVAVVEQTASGYRVAGGRGFLEFAREITGDAEAELQRTLLYCRSEMGEDLRTLYVGQELPEETVAVGLALHYFAEPRFNFLVKERAALAGIAGIAVGKRFLKIAAAGAVLALLPHVAAYGYRVQAAEYLRRADALAPQVKKYASLKAEREKYEDWAAIVDSFAVTPAWPLMEDIRRAVPSRCWLTSIKTEQPAKTPGSPQKSPAPASPGNEPGASGQTAGGANAGGAAQGTAAKKAPAQPASTLPDRPAGVTLEGYSLDAASVGLLRDNLESLPWCGGVTSVSARWDDQTGAYSFKIAAAVKQQSQQDQKGVKK
jgi:hypothetical protein